MKIAYLSSSVIPSRAANSVHVMKMCNAFIANGHDVTLYAPRHKEKEEGGVADIYDFYNVSIFNIKKKPSPKTRYIRNIIYAFSCLYSLLTLKPKLVYGRDFLSSFLAAFFFPTIYEAHAPLKGVKLSLLKMMLRGKKLKRLVVISDALKDIFLIDAGIARYQEKLYVAHDGADMVTNTDNKLMLQGDSANIQVGYIGHLYKGRGVDVLFDCAENITGANFHIVGGTEEDIIYWQDELIRRKIQNVYFYGFISPAEASDITSLFDVLVAPYANVVSVHGGKGDTSEFMSPLKIFEYMSHGKAIICSDLPVIREVLNGSNSILVTPDDIDEWIDAINKMTDEGLRTKLGKQALHDFLKAYTWKTRAKNVIELI